MSETGDAPDSRLVDDPAEEAVQQKAAAFQPGVTTLPIGLLMGALFGFAIQKGQVYAPQRIVRQFLLTDFTMLKMFLSAAVVSSVAHAVVSVVARDRFVRARNDNAGDPKPLLQVAAGTGLLGVGMAVCGNCPGTVLGSIGSGIAPAFVTFGGGLVGVLVHAALDGAGVIGKVFGAGPEKNVYLDEVAQRRFGSGVQYWHLALGTAAMLVGVISLVEVLSPYVPIGRQTGNVFGYQSWSPIVSGVIVGSLQIPGLVFVRRSLGSSSGYVTLAAQPFRCIPRAFDLMPALRCKLNGYVNMFQPLYLAGAIAGAAIGASLGGVLAWRDTIGDPLGGMPYAHSFFGGFLILFGSRIADGCTSGHGLSSFAQMTLDGWVGTCAMFGGAIVTAMTLRAAGAFPNFVL